MTSEATAETMNLNDEGTEVNAQVAAQVNPPSDTATVDDIRRQVAVEAEYRKELSELRASGIGQSPVGRA